MTKNRAHRAVRVEFNQQTWDRMQKVAEYHDRYLKTLVAEIIRAEVDRLYDEMLADQPQDDDPATYKELMSGQRQWSEEALRIIDKEGLTGDAADGLLTEYQQLDADRDARLGGQS